VSTEQPELRAAYQTLNEPTRLLGLSLGGWAVMGIAGGAGYGWLLVSPLPWRMNFTLAVLVLGAPAALMLLREQSTISPARLLAAVLRWRTRPALLVAPSGERPVTRGAVRLDTVAPEPEGKLVSVDELPWLRHEAGEVGEEAR
jgi:MFS family permease